MHLQITSVLAAAAALINLWLGIRVGQKRQEGKVPYGDGGYLPLIRRMRAQANFVEYTAFVIILCALVELRWGSTLWLWALAAVYLVGRLAHPFGMEAEGLGKGRMVGMMTTMLVTLVLVVMVVIAAYQAGGIRVAPDAVGVNV